MLLLYCSSSVQAELFPKQRKPVMRAEGTWNTDTMYALGLYRSLTHVLGIWPPDHHKWTSKVKVAGGSILQLSMIIIFIKNLITKGNCSIITDLVDASSLIATSILSILKLILPQIHYKSMYLIVNSAIEDWNNIRSEKSRTIMLKYAYMGRFVFIVQMCGAYTTIIPLIFGNPPNFGTNNHQQNPNITPPFRNIPIGPNCWLSQSVSENIYLAYYFLVTLHLIILCTAYIGGDVYIFGIAMHVCGQFELLYYDVESLDGTENDSVLREKIRHLMQRHCHLLKLATEFENAFNVIILLQVAANTFIISVSGLLLIWGLQAGDTEIVIGSIIRIYLLYFQLYIYSYIGENLKTQAGKLQDAVYNCPWYKMLPSVILDLKFIMLRSNYPFHLTAGKIYSMNMPNFQNLVKTMFSYFSVIRLMFGE